MTSNWEIELEVVCLQVALGIHPDGEIVASSQLAHTPTILVWSSTKLEILAALVGGHSSGVGQLCFVGAGRSYMSI